MQKYEIVIYSLTAKEYIAIIPIDDKSYDTVVELAHALCFEDVFMDRRIYKIRKMKAGEQLKLF